MKTILCMTGRSAVGKSTVSKELATAYGLPWFSFGAYQRELLGANPSDLSVVQQKYLELWPLHLARISADMSERGIILEGLYHISFLDKLQQSFQHHDIRLVAIRASKSDRLLFYNGRTGRTEEQKIKSLNDLDNVKKAIGIIDVLKAAERRYANVYGDIGSCLKMIQRDFGGMNGNRTS